MGRSERRKIARALRIEDNKGMVHMTRQELNQIIEEKQLDIARFDSEIWCTAFAMALHDQEGFGKKRAMRCLDEVNDLFIQILNDETYYAELSKRMEDELNIVIKS